MKVVEYDASLLFDFFIANGLDFTSSRSFFGEDVISYVIYDKDKLIGGIALSSSCGLNFIDALAVDKDYRGRGYGTLLVNKVLESCSKPVYVIPKAEELYSKLNFKYQDSWFLDRYGCNACEKKGKSCFPKVMSLR